MNMPKAFPDKLKPKVDKLLRAAVSNANLKIIALDDDPTGVQTVHGVSVYTDWSVDSLREGFLEDAPLFFILTNSRAMSETETQKVHHEIIGNIARVASEQHKEFLVISRSDSTLRGHYPLEMDVIRQELEAAAGMTVDGEILCPYFGEGGRITIGNVHYVAGADGLVPAAETEFAKDKTFGYVHSDLRDYIEEKSNGMVRAGDVRSISIKQLRAMDIDGISDTLYALCDHAKLVVNAADDYDVKVFCIAMFRALKRGKHFCCRTAASFIKAVAAIPDRPLLMREDLIAEETRHGGIVMVGSHTAKTTAQLTELLTLPQTETVELNSDLVLKAGALERETARVIRTCNALIRAGKTPVVFTRRSVLSLPDDNGESALARSVRISDAVQAVVAELTAKPAFIIAKGGITSSDIATKALQVRKAQVLGQIAPGVPVWETGPESRFPGIPYVIFPGNVGQPDTLRHAAQILLNQET